MAKTKRPYVYKSDYTLINAIRLSVLGLDPIPGTPEDRALNRFQNEARRIGPEWETLGRAAADAMRKAGTG
jgi:hypothetical protein